MKKLLTLLGTVGLTAIGGTSVVACQVHTDFSHWDANEMLGEVIMLNITNEEIQGKNTQKDLDTVVESNWTFHEVFSNTNFLPKLVYEKVVQTAHKKLEDAKVQDITIDITETEIDNELKNWIEDWATSGGIHLVEIGEVTRKLIESNFLENETLVEYITRNASVGVTGFGIAFDMNHTKGKVQSLQSAGNNQYGLVAAGSVWKFAFKDIEKG